MCTPAEPCPVQEVSSLLDGTGEWETPPEGDIRREGASAFGTNDSSSVEGNLNLYRVVREGEKKLRGR